jgi:PAS domain S-box-containing protein
VADDGYRTLLDVSPQALLVHRDFVPCYANRALAVLFGYRDEAEILALRTNLELVDPTEHDHVRALATARMSGESVPHDHEFRCVRKDGTRFWAEVIASTVPWDGETGVQVCFRDISRRKAAEEQLRESRKLLHTVIDSLPMFVFVKDRESNYVMVNKTMKDFYGLEEEDFASMTPKSLPIQSGEEKAMILGDDRVVFETRQPYIQPVVPVTKPDGTQTYRHSIKIPLFDETGEMTGLLGVGEDITERKRVEQDLQRVYDELEQRVEDRTAALRESESALTASESELRKLAGNLLSAQEAERRSFARELHDDLTQRLAILALDVDALGRDHSGVAEAMRELQTRIADIASDAQGMARRLHPSILDDLGLVKALKAECVHFSNREGIDVTFTHHDVPATLSKSLSLSLYRITQESLRNISKHAASPVATVDLACPGDGEIRLAVEDHGVGFPPEDPGPVDEVGGLGLISMRERARLAGGTCSVRSSPGRGTIVDVRLPIDGETP